MTYTAATSVSRSTVSVRRVVTWAWRCALCGATDCGFVSQRRAQNAAQRHAMRTRHTEMRVPEPAL